MVILGDWQIDEQPPQIYRAARKHESTILMNVTLKLPDELVREARHRAVNQSQSLSAWMAALVRRELTLPAEEGERPMTLTEAMRVPGMPDSFYEKDFPLPDRKETKHREFTFEPDDD